MRSTVSPSVHTAFVVSMRKTEEDISAGQKLERLQ